MNQCAFILVARFGSKHIRAHQSAGNANGKAVFRLIGAKHLRRSPWFIDQKKSVPFGDGFSGNQIKANLVLLLLTLIEQDEHEHVACKPEGRADRDRGEASLQLCDHGVRREGERTQQDRHEDEDSEREDAAKGDVAFSQKFLVGCVFHLWA